MSRQDRLLVHVQINVREGLFLVDQSVVIDNASQIGFAGLARLLMLLFGHLQEKVFKIWFLYIIKKQNKKSWVVGRKGGAAWQDASTAMRTCSNLAVPNQSNTVSMQVWGTTHLSRWAKEARTTTAGRKYASRTATTESNCDNDSQPPLLK